MSRTSGMPATDLPSADRHGSGSGSSAGYKVEVRSSYYQPTVLEGFVIDNVWRRLPIARGANPWGVNIPIREMDADMLRHGLVSQEAAEAHRWALIAHLDAARVGGSLCIETRLVEVRYHWTYHTEEVGVSDPLNATEHRRGMTFSTRFPSATEPDESAEAA